MFSTHGFVIKKNVSHTSFILLKYPTLQPLLWFRIGSRNCVKITDRTKCKLKSVGFQDLHEDTSQ